MFDIQTAAAAEETQPSLQSATAPPPPPRPAPAVAARPIPLPLRNDTLIGVCEAIGRDFGFNPNLLRIALALGLYVSPLAVIGTYLALGAAVAVSHLLYPDERQPPIPLAARPRGTGNRRARA